VTEHDNLDRRLTGWFEADALGPAPVGRFEEAIEATREHRPRSTLLAGLGSHWAEAGIVAKAPRVSWRSIAVFVLVAVALAAGAVMVGSQQRRLPAVVEPAVVEPAGNGFITYSSGGDIYVGDPVTGTTTAIVTGPATDSRPIFSPDGTHIAFVRGDRWGADASVVVVSPDGSGEVIAMPAGFSERGVGIAWTPDSASLVANLDTAPLRTPSFDGELALLNASGLAEPRLLTPPLPISPGGPYFNANSGVAPMFRPPNGDLILFSDNDALSVFDADMRSRGQLARPALSGFEPYGIGTPAWSPDGSMISFSLHRVNGNHGIGLIDVFVMNTDASSLRPLEADIRWMLAWSPDGSMIAAERGRTDREGAVLVVIDVSSGDVRVLEATSVETKVEGDWSLDSGGSSSTGRKWDYEGWSWSPDGRSMLLLERSGTRPNVVDVESGKATELPWEADSAPSWQRVAID
jgi:dipeptidyl aminopeptidase/acylaminoacyl peptidase